LIVPTHVEKQYTRALKYMSHKQQKLNKKPWITKGIFYPSICCKKQMYKTHYLFGEGVR